jgi:hypothetical protein
MEPAAKRILDHHLPYELDMLEHALEFVLSDDLAAHPNINTLRNFSIEAFWTHARNLNEFMNDPRNNNASGIAAARDFTVDDAPMRYRLDDQLQTKINGQILHLQYERPETDNEKLMVYDMQRVYDAINSAVKEFESRLSADAKKIWKARSPRDSRGVPIPLWGH